MRTSGTGPAGPVLPGTGRWRPLGLGEVEITGGFWAERQRVNATATLPHLEHWMEREGWLGNFDLAAAGRLPAGRRGPVFADSEPYKLLEAMAWELGRPGAGASEARFRAIVDRVAAAQEPDGYLGTAFGRPGQPDRWSDLPGGHELYCLGHLFQAAVARARTGHPDDPLVEVARRAADLVCAEFGPAGRRAVCGHAEIETGLLELARVTGSTAYRDQAARFVDLRGRGTLGPHPWGDGYFQDEIPVREATVLRGHAVRAGYLAAGATDVAVETGDADLLAALARQWAATVARRTYLTGGQGSNHLDESFGEDWDLPPDRAYAETCAGVASIMFSWRLMLALGDDVGYADLIERTLLNVVAAGVADDGRAFFYANTLHRRRAGEPPSTESASRGVAPAVRAAWFGVSCCPPNIARTLAALAGYLATTDDDGLQLHQYATARIRAELPGGRRAAFDVSTGYPDDGVVRIEVRENSGGPWTLTLRVPNWAVGAELEHRPTAGGGGTAAVAPGHATITADFRTGDVVELRLPVAARFTVPDARIDAVRGCVAVERGPAVLCLESVDLADAAHRLGTDPEHLLERATLDVAAGAPEVAGRVLVTLVHPADAPDADWPYRTGDVDGGGAEGGVPGALPDGGRESRSVRVPLVPYHAWAERGPSAMRVWLPVAGATAGRAVRWR